MWRNTEIGVVIYGRIRTFYLCFIYTPVATLDRVRYPYESAVIVVVLLSFFQSRY